MKLSAQRALFYAGWTLAALLAICASEALLQNGHTVYLHFDASVLTKQWQALAACLLLAGAAGAALDRPQYASALQRLPRTGLLFLLLVGMFQILRRSPDTIWLTLPGAKLIALGLCLTTSVGVALLLKDQTQRRLISALGLSSLLVFALQPGMVAWLIAQSSSHQHAAPLNPAQEAVARRTVVLVLDEWDEQIAERESFFDHPELREFMRASFRNTAAIPAGTSTLVSIPGMLRGQRFGKVDFGGPGYLVDTEGERFDAHSAQLFGDLAKARIPHSVVGFYHDYCSIAVQARRCSVVPLRFFPGWWSALSRPLRPEQDLQDAGTDFMRNFQDTFSWLHKNTLEAVSDEQSQMVWLHLNVPHPPKVIAGPLGNGLLDDYKANLDIAAQLIAEVQGALAKQAKPSALVVLSDHWLREKEFWRLLYERQRGPGTGRAGKTDDQRVPFLVWFSDASQAVNDSKPISTTVIRPLVLALLDGRIAKPADLPAFLATIPQDTSPIPILYRPGIHASDGHHD